MRKKPLDYYTFRVSSSEVDGRWRKDYALIPDGKRKPIREEHIDIPTKFNRYEVSVQFKNDTAAIEWFNTHYRGF